MKVVMHYVSLLQLLPIRVITTLKGCCYYERGLVTGRTGFQEVALPGGSLSKAFNR